jgi:hypothetical protein
MRFGGIVRHQPSAHGIGAVGVGNNPTRFNSPFSNASETRRNYSAR